MYNKFKLHFYQEIFQRFQNREASLTTVETFCMEAIQALARPTVNEFATFMRISTPNAAYKVSSLIRKGYLRKVQSQADRREYHLEVTQRYLDYYDVSSTYVEQVMSRITERFRRRSAAGWNPCCALSAGSLCRRCACRSTAERMSKWPNQKAAFGPHRYGENCGGYYGTGY